MKKEYKKFEDLEFFERLEFRMISKKSSQAVMHFENGYGVSVLLGDLFYSNGVDSYEIAILYCGKIVYNTSITDGVFSHVSTEDITEIMRKVQDL